ncbi:MAG: response regulator [Usitatibacter sp.]
MTAPLRVLLVDDHPLVRAGLRAVIERTGAIVVAEAGGGLGALALVEEHAPDLVIMDIGMEDLDGIEATAQIKSRWPAVRVLVVSAHSDSNHVIRAMRARADGYLIKDTATSEVGAAVAAVAAGEMYLSRGISRHVVYGMLEGSGAAPASLGSLSPRQREILVMIAEGRSTKQIAFTLELSVKTVETHRARIMERLESRDVAGLAVYAVRTGLIDVDKVPAVGKPAASARIS